MKKTLIGTTLLALSLLTACGTEQAEKEHEKDDVVVEEAQTETETSETTTEEAVDEVTDETTGETSVTPAVIGLDGLSDEQVVAAKKAIDVFLTNIEASEAEDIDLYLTTIADEIQEVTRTGLVDMFAELDLDYNIIGDIEVVSVSDDLNTIEIRVTQETMQLTESPHFRDNKITALHTLTLAQDGTYRIQSSVPDLESIEYLGDVPQALDGLGDVSEEELSEDVK